MGGHAYAHDVLVLIRGPAPSECEVVSPGAFDLHFLIVGDVERLLVSLLAICMSTGEMSVQVRCPFFN